MGVYGGNLGLLSDQAEILFLVILKKTLTHIMKVSARKKQVIKKVITIKHLTNLYEMNNSFCRT